MAAQMDDEQKGGVKVGSLFTWFEGGRWMDYPVDGSLTGRWMYLQARWIAKWKNRWTDGCVDVPLVWMVRSWIS